MALHPCQKCGTLIDGAETVCPTCTTPAAETAPPAEPPAAPTGQMTAQQKYRLILVALIMDGLLFAGIIYWFLIR